MVTSKRLNSTLDASKTNETSDIRDLAQPSVTNVTYIREETTILAITNVTYIREEATMLATTNVTPIREITTVMSDLMNKLATNWTAATAQSKIILTTIVASD